MGLCIVQVKLMLQGLLFVITGELLNLLAIPLGYCSVLKAEAAGLEFGLATALRFGFKNIPVEGDSQVLIRLLRLHKDWSLANLDVVSGYSYAGYSSSCFQLSSHLELNLVAEALAAMRHAKELFGNIFKASFLFSIKNAFEQLQRGAHPLFWGRKKKPSSSEEPKPGLGVGPTKKGWPEGSSSPSSSSRGDDVSMRSTNS
ncbi:Hypothetical predicted protein [Prunus dulcis]|uniref:RNase H type-1 domain-containing protein n=1 Tax=Prunus dulcis TaxID=3755 RepID=A0A5E4GB69_PRUDU|nr:Hypothetical predicted protein [Prunus dulcis]